jgi:hypothetical protein
MEDEMKKCGLSDLKKFCWNTKPNNFYVEIKHNFRALFNSIEVLTFPDSICLKNDNEIYLTIYGISYIIQDGEKFFVHCDFYGTDIEVVIICLS